MRKFLLMMVFCLFAVMANAEFKYAMLGVNGLTCSACSRAVEMSIRKLPFVKDVDMNLENTEGKIFFKEGADVDIEKLARAVKEAGFSVRYLSAVYNFQKQIGNTSCVEEGKYTFHVIGSTAKNLIGEVNMIFLGQDFQSRKEYSKVRPSLTAQCPVKNKIYFVKVS